MSNRRGFISESWQVVNATALGFPPDIPHRNRRSSQRAPARGGSARGDSSDQCENNVDGIDYDIVGPHCDNPLGLWSPNLFAVGNKSVSRLAKEDEVEVSKDAAEKRSQNPLGKILVYRQAKMMIVLLINNWEEHEEEPPRQLYISPVALNSANADAINMKALSLKTQNDDDGMSEDIYGVRIATLCAFVQQALTPEIKEYEAAIVASVSTQKQLPAGVQILSYNKLTKSLQRFGYGVPPGYNPLAIWPYKLGLKKNFLTSPSSRKSSSSAGDSSGNNSRSSSPKFGLSTGNKEKHSHPMKSLQMQKY